MLPKSFFLSWFCVHALIIFIEVLKTSTFRIGRNKIQISTFKIKYLFFVKYKYVISKCVYVWGYFLFLSYLEIDRCIKVKSDKV